MKFISTKGKSKSVSLSEAICLGKAPDGGLYIPEKLPLISKSSLSYCSSLPEFAFEILNPFYEDDILQKKLVEICCSVFNNPSNIISTDKGYEVNLESSGAKFYASCLNYLFEKDGKTMTLLLSEDDIHFDTIISAFSELKYVNTLVVKKEEKKEYLAKGNFFMMEPTNIAFVLSMTVFYYYVSKLIEKPTLVINSKNYSNSVAALWSFGMGAVIEKIILDEDENHFAKRILEENEEINDYPKEIDRLVSFFPEKHCMKNILDFYTDETNELYNSDKLVFIKIK